MMFDIDAIRNDFPILRQKIYNKPLIYFDNAATTQKPQCVIDKLVEVYTTYNANIHRGVHYLSNKATDETEKARKVVQLFLHAPYSHEIIFTRGATEAINLVAQSFGEKFIHRGDEIIVSEMEHHSNLVPWQLVAERQGARIVKWPFNQNGELEISVLKPLITEKTRLIAVNHVSNSLGTINPVKEIIDLAHQHEVAVLVDGAQAVQHIKVDVQQLGCDFYVFSGHKIYGPTGIGVENIAAYEKELLNYAEEKLRSLPGIEFYGTAHEKTSVISFNLHGAHPFDVGTLLDKMGIAVRTGTHCTEPVMQHFGIPGTVRASFAFYNTKKEVDGLYLGLQKVVQMLA